MPDLIIKPTTTSGNKLILQDQAGGAVLTTADSGATIGGATIINTSGAITTTGAFTSKGIDDNADATAITIDSNENVGIGATAPNSLLHIKKSASGVMPALHLERDGAMNHYIGYDTNNKLIIGENVDMVTNARLAIATDGKVGIGTTSPAGFCHVHLTGGWTFVSQNIADGGYNYHNDFRDSDGTQCGYIRTAENGGTTYSTSSDYRRKENVEPLVDGLTRLNQLKPVRFNWKKDTNKIINDGFLAHEVSDIVAEAVTGEKDAVSEDINDDKYEYGSPIYQTIDLGKLVPLLVGAVQELSAKNDALEAENTALKTRMDALEARVTALET